MNLTRLHFNMLQIMSERVFVRPLKILLSFIVLLKYWRKLQSEKNNTYYWSRPAVQSI